MTNASLIEQLQLFITGFFLFLSFFLLANSARFLFIIILWAGLLTTIAFILAGPTLIIPAAIIGALMGIRHSYTFSTQY